MQLECWCLFCLQPVRWRAIPSVGGSAMIRCARPSAVRCAASRCAKWCATGVPVAVRPSAACGAAATWNGARPTRAPAARRCATYRAARPRPVSALFCARRQCANGSAASRATARARAASSSARRLPASQPLCQPVPARSLRRWRSRLCCLCLASERTGE